MTTRNSNSIRPGAKSINLALQGGGAHGAFTWGVLDRLLEDERIVIEALSGTSAGAMNAVVLADGLKRGGPEGARARLRLFWEAVSRTASFSPIQRGPVDMWTGNWSLDHSPAYLFFDMMTHAMSPYQFNPFNYNPLKEIVERLVDFDAVRACDSVKLFISATNVETGRVKVFHREELTADKVMASACLPIVFQTVEVEGQYYWDGGYMGNPVLFPFYGACKSSDILIVQINPVEHKGVPVSAHEIMDRVNEISFNASLLAELRAIDFVRRMLTEGRLDTDRYRAMHVHIIEGHKELANLGVSSKLNAERAFIERLFGHGRDAAAAWLDTNFNSIGERSTVDIRRMFQGDGYDTARR